MSISSLPSPHGIGTMGQEAYRFVDFLVKARQEYWQMLPVGPTSYGDSPYQSFSSFAGNPYMIDLDLLVESGLISSEMIDDIDWGDDPEKVNYGKIYNGRFDVLRAAYKAAMGADTNSFFTFCAQNKEWLDDYCLFMALKNHFGGASWTEWPDEDIRLHKPESCKKYRELLKEECEFYAFIQFLFFGQWDKLKEYASYNGIKIIGDIPIYVAMDSADVWAEPEWFKLNSDNIPVEVAGVPPDYFNADGQLWGNPLYDWDKLKADDYRWWIRRISGSAHLYDVLRIDHFRGIESYYSIPAGETTARNGRWVKGPGIEFVNAIKKAFPDLSLIAEDLGYLTEGVIKLLADSKLPGMKILEFAFDTREPADFRPCTYTENSICYTGTHDNTTLKEWMEDTIPENLKMAEDYFDYIEEKNFIWKMIEGGMETVSNLFICQMQDYLELGKGYRMNTPGTSSGNWMWRMKADACTDKLAQRIAKLAVKYNRA